MQIRSLKPEDKERVNNIVSIHMATFQGFFLTFMGVNFLKLMYKSYLEFNNSGILAAFKGQKLVGFLAYSGDMNGLYRYMIRKKLLPFAWYSLGALLRKPTVFLRLVRALLKPSEALRDEKYVELASIGVDPNAESKGVGSLLIDKLKEMVDFDEYKYITLETDAINNERVNSFYQKNGFSLYREFETHEGRKMYEYRFSQIIRR